jgi:hypothetical protein
MRHCRDGELVPAHCYDDGGMVPVGTVLVLPPGELRSCKFVPPDRLGEVTVERLVRRIRFALLALQEGSTIELTNGLRAI